MVRTASLAVLTVALLGGVAVGSAPPIQVHEGTALVPGAPGVTTPVSFGTADVAVAKARTFTVRNTSAQEISVDPLIQLPQGFTMARRPEQRTLKPGEATTFAVALNAARAGFFAGPVTVRTSAGAVSIPIEGTALGRPAVRIIDNTDAGFRALGRWVSQPGQGLAGGALAIPPGQGTNVAAWTFRGLTPGLYQVSATWTPGNNRAADARYTLVNGRHATVVVVNQQGAPAGFRDAGLGWQNVGQPFRIDGHTLVVQLSDLASGAVVADAVRIERVGHTGQIQTPADPTFKASGNWTLARGRTVAVESTNGAASWTFNVKPGQYRVSANWLEGVNLTNDARYTIADGQNVLATVSVNQQLPPAHFRDAGARWQDLGPLGGLYKIASGKLTVTLSGPSEGPGAAGGGRSPLRSAGLVRIEQGNGPSVQVLSDTVRFLEQSTWGATAELAQFVDAIGIENYLYLQYYIPAWGWPSLPLMPQNVQTGCGESGTPEYQTCVRENYSMYPLQNWFFLTAMYGDDQLRQRMVWALHKFIVVAGTEADTRLSSRMAYYMQILERNAFGSFANLLYEITLNPAMGAYLDMLGSTRTRPNENFAREILQLFSIGLDKLNPDGTPILDGQGNKVPTYTQPVVEGFTKVFTGWQLAAQPEPGVANYRDPMLIPNDTVARNNHDWTQKLLLDGATLPATPTQAQQTAARANQELVQGLDNIFYNPNVGPFISKLLIQSLVTSNPSPDYVARVAAVFDNDGTGTRGNLGAVSSAILMDPEARQIPTDPYFGKLREPVQYALNILRGFYAVSRDATYYSDGVINGQTANIAQSVLLPPSVFSYFTPDNVLPGETTALAPEFQIYDTANAIRRANFVNQMTFGNGISSNTTTTPYGTSLQLFHLEALANNPGGMADFLNDLMLHGTMSPEMRSAIVTAVNAVPSNNPLKRARTALYLVATSSQYQVQR